jgi:uncharacterized membrane protein YukC
LTKERGYSMYDPISGIIALATIVWYFVWSYTLFKNQRKQTALMEEQKKYLKGIYSRLTFIDQKTTKK